jgi:hypothetical protein
MYTFKFVQNIPISMFPTKYFSFYKSNARCDVTWGELVGWTCNLGIDIVTILGKQQMHNHDDVGAKP